MNSLKLGNFNNTLLIVTAIAGAMCIMIGGTITFIPPNLFLLILSVIAIILLQKFLHLSIGGTFRLLFITLIPFSLTDFSRINLAGNDIPIFVVFLPLLLIDVITQFVRKQIKITIPIIVELLLLFSILVPAAISSAVATPSTASIISFGKFGISILCFCILVISIASWDEWKKLLWMLLFSSLVVALWALYRYLYDPIHWYRLQMGEDRSINLSAFMLGFPFFISFGYAITKKRLAHTLPYFTFMVILGASIVATYSRGIWISMIICIAVFVLLSWRNIIWYRVIIVLVFISANIIFVGVEKITERLSSLISWQDNFTGDNSNLVRLNLLQLSWDQIAQAPILGSGFGFQLDDISVGMRNAHNSYLELWISSGVFAILLFIIFVILHGILLWRYRKNLNQESLLGNILIAYFCGVVFHLIIQSFVTSITFWALLSIQVSAVNLSINYSPNRDSM
jgi:O-antigen ligase